MPEAHAIDHYANPGDVRVDADKLHSLSMRVLVATGVPAEHARMTSDVLLCSDLRGIESHGAKAPGL